MAIGITGLTGDAKGIAARCDCCCRVVNAVNYRYGRLTRRLAAVNFVIYLWKNIIPALDLGEKIKIFGREWRVLGFE